MVKTFSASYRDIMLINYAVHYNHPFSHMKPVYILTTSFFKIYFDFLLMPTPTSPPLGNYDQNAVCYFHHSYACYMFYQFNVPLCLMISGPFKVSHSVTPLLLIHSQLQLTCIHPFITDHFSPCAFIFYLEDGGSSFMKMLAPIY